MRVRCENISGSEIVMLLESGNPPIIGRYYSLEDITSGSSAQNKAFHALCKAWWEWMHRNGCLEFEFNGIVYNFETPDWLAFREFWKARYGEGFNHVEYVDNFYSMQRVKVFKDVPLYARADFEAGNRGRVKGVLKSWSDYTMPQRRKAIQNMLDIIPCSGCDDPKVIEIMEGMEKDFNYERRTA